MGWGCRTIVVGVVAVSSLLAAVPAQAGDAAARSGPYARAQAAVDYTVYRPSVLLGIGPRTSFQRVPCPSRDDAISVQYGEQATRSDRFVGINEAPGTTGCLDGPDGVGPWPAITVDGVRVQVNGSCARPAGSCAQTSLRLIERQAYSTFVLPPTGGRTTSTFVELYTSNVSLAGIRSIVAGLVPVQ